jgi:hypothetical protein
MTSARTRSWRFRILFRLVLTLILTGTSTAYRVSPLFAEKVKPRTPGLESHAVSKSERAQTLQEDARVVLDGLTANIVPDSSNLWQCACDTDGCFPGCFTIASATILDYWATRGYPKLWDGETNATLQRLRDLFPNLFCYDNVDNDGKPGESGYDAFDVARGFNIFIEERGYRFKITPIPSPSFEQIRAEIDAGRPLIGAFGASPWGSHAGTIIGYDTTGGRQVMIVRPNLAGKIDTELVWGRGYGSFGVVTIEPTGEVSEAAATAQRDITVQIDDFDPGFVLKGDAWETREGFGVNGASRSVLTTDPSNLGPLDDTATARWTPNLPYDGMYEVQAFMPREDSDDTNTYLATYQVQHAEGMALVRRSQHDAKPGWMSLGMFPFVRGENAFVKVGNRTGDQPPRKLWADAVRLIWKGPLLVQREGGPVAVIVNGQAQELRDEETLEALRLKQGVVRAVDEIQYAQYPRGDAMQSVYAGWMAQYFDNENLTPPFSVLRSENVLNKSWGGAAPAAGLSGRRFSVRYARVMALTEGEYPFVLEAAGGVRMWVDGKLVVDEWDAGGAFIQHARTVPVLSGLHRIEVEYRHRGEGSSRIRFGNLPPNAPVVVDNEQTAPLTTTGTIQLRWLDAGDPDSIGGGKPRRYFATLWRSDGFRSTSGWITNTVWSARLPTDGVYQWNVIASDGVANSAPSRPQTIMVDNTPPWTQMQSALPSMDRAQSADETNNSGLRLQTNADGVQVVVDSGPREASTAFNRLIVRDQAIYKRFGRAPAVRLTWWATDTVSLNGATYMLQARELVRARTEYTLTAITRDVPKQGQTLVLSGSQEILQPVTLTESVTFTDVAPITTMVTLTNAEWITIGVSLNVTETVFIGHPGSTYEFRVRGIDAAGNEQAWFDGYSIQIKLDEETELPRDLKPMTLYNVERVPIETVLTATAAAPLTPTLGISGPVTVPVTLLVPVAPLSDTFTATVPLTATQDISGATPLTGTVPLSDSLATPEPTPGLATMPTIPADGVVGGVPVPVNPVATPTPGGLVTMPTIPPQVIPTETPAPTDIPIPVATATPPPSTATSEPTATSDAGVVP